MPLTTFDPGANGFIFANSWTLSDSERDALRARLTDSVAKALGMLSAPFPGAFLLLRLIPRVSSAVAAGAPDGYGLCGGMTFAALDHWHEGGQQALATRFATRPDPGSPDYVYLWQRQIQSLAANAHVFVARMAELHLLPKIPPFGGGATGLLRSSRTEWQKLRSAIDSGQPVPVGLIGASADPFTNHQVLAYGYEASGAGTGRILLYDPNCPGAASHIDIDLTGAVLKAEEQCGAPTRGALRGFFCETYTPVTPPWS